MSKDLPPPALWPELTTSLPTLQYPSTLNVADELVDRHVLDGFGARPAVITSDRTVTYAELQQLVNQAAAALIALGITPGDRVALWFPNGLAFAVCWLAIQKIGGVAVAMLPMFRAHELTAIVDDAQPSLLVCPHDLVTTARSATAGRIRVIEDESLVAVAQASGPASPLKPNDVPIARTGPDDLAVILYTTGSDGSLKGAAHARRHVLASADTYAREVLGATPDDVFGGSPPLALAFGLGALLVFPLRFGGAALLMEGLTVDGWLRAVGAHRMTVLVGAPTFYRLALKHPRLDSDVDWRSVRLAVSAGEPLPATVYEEWTRRTGVEMLDGIGTTELFHIFLSSRRGAVRPGSTGIPVSGYDARLVDRQLETVSRGTPGLLAVRGPTGCRYWRKPEHQQEYVRAGWNLTGDIYVQDEAGYFWFQSRADNLIISGGYNIAAPEVEQALRAHPAVAEATVVGKPDPVRGQIVAASIVLRPGHEPSHSLVDAIQEHVRRTIAPYKCPRRIEFSENGLRF